MVKSGRKMEIKWLAGSAGLVDCELGLKPRLLIF